MRKSKFYAIGLKGWVQIRECQEPPQRLETVAFIPVKEEREVWDPKNSFYRYKTITVKRKLVNVVYEGGVELLTLSHPTFSRRLKMGVAEHECLMLTPAQVNLLKGKRNVKARVNV